jgi:hypothetical protein
MEQAGNYKPVQLNSLRRLDQKLNFYLAHDLRTTAYSAEWRLWYPAGLTPADGI